MKKRLYHRTTTEAAFSILENGFNDGNPIPIEQISLCGVWLANAPLTTMGAKGNDALLEVHVDLPKSEFDFYELIEDGKPYREWCFPAELLRRSEIRLIEEEN